jgi:hypothetical protein
LLDPTHRRPKFAKQMGAACPPFEPHH